MRAGGEGEAARRQRDFLPYLSTAGRGRALKGKKQKASSFEGFEIAMTQGFSEPELFLHLLRAAVPFLPILPILLLLLPHSGRFRGPLASVCGRSQQETTKRCPQNEKSKPRPNQPLHTTGSGREANSPAPPAPPHPAPGCGAHARRGTPAAILQRQSGGEASPAAAQRSRARALRPRGAGGAGGAGQ